MALTVKFLSTKKEKDDILNDFAQLRLNYMAEWPNYTKQDPDQNLVATKYLFDKNITVVSVFDDKKLVGANVTAKYNDIFTEENNFPHKKFFYRTNQKPEDFAHTVFVLNDPGYRGKGIGKLIFDNVDVLAKQLGCKGITLDSIIRSSHDPRTPKDYKDSSGFFKAIGYQKIVPNLNIIALYTDFDGTKPTKYYQSWVKYL